MSDPPNLIEVLNDTEGLAWGLYYHLWKKTHKGEACPNVSIPHTVVYQDSAPIAWYFMSAKDNKIYRKKRTNITGPAICDALVHKHPEVDACAWFSGTMTFMSSAPKKRRTRTGPQAGEVYELEPEEDTKEPACFDYLSCERLQRLVAPGQYTAITESIYDGVLQKFVMPREAYDHVIRAIWSPTACVCERRCSNFMLNDDRQPLTDRMASFDSNTFWLSTHQPLPAGSVLVQRLTTACESIVRHLAETSAGRISVARMQLLFKVDTHNRIWLTLCNSLRLDRSAASVDRTPNPIKYKRKDVLDHQEDTRIPDDPTPFMCVVTGKTHPGSDRCDVSYKLLISEWFKEISELQEESDRLQALDNIPPAIRRANPNITREYYLRMRAQPTFLLKTAPVCREAAGSITAAALKDLSRTIARPRSALADSAVLCQVVNGTAAADKAAAAAAAARAKPPVSTTSGALKLMISKGPPPPPPSNPDLLYEPGTQIPSALIPKAALAAAAAACSPKSPGGRSGSATMVPITRSLPQMAHQQKQGQPRGASQRQAQQTGPLPLASASGPLPGGVASPSSTRVKHTTAYLASPGGPARPVQAVSSATAALAVGHGAGMRKSAFDTRPSKSTDPSPSVEERSVHRGEPYVPGRRPTSATRAVPMSKTAGMRLQGGAEDGAPAASGNSGATRASHVSSEDLRTLKQLSEAYASAEAVTQQLLAEAQACLAEAAAPGLDTNGIGAKAKSVTPPKSGVSSKPGSGTASARESSRPPSAKPPAAPSKPVSRTGSGSSMLQPKQGGVVAGAAGVNQPAPPAVGLTPDEALLLSDALQATQEP